jgi:glycosyltransferase involved in cell wall biosynthesis
MRIVVAIPVLNEEQVLRATVEEILRFAASGLSDHETIVVVADNGSTDKTREIGPALAAERPAVRYRRLEERGKGLAIRTVWSENPADVYVFMDADLATDLAAMPSLVAAAAESGGLAIGSRFLSGSKVDRSLLRRILSRGYRLFARLMLRTEVSDLPCGFKAAAPRVVSEVVPVVKNNGWFFDTELVIRAERAGLPVREIPVAWSEERVPGRRSRVAVMKLIREYVRQVFLLRRDLMSGR